MGAACHTGNRTISTHSLTRRLTVKSVYVSFGVVISTHSLTRRLTERQTLKRGMNIYFNSQPHKEADVSCNLLKPPKSHFNSQPHKEADVQSSHVYSERMIFQLTASQGG